MGEAGARRDALWSNDRVWARFYRDGKNLGEIAEEFGCSIYALSPWLTAPLARAAIDAGREALTQSTTATPEEAERSSHGG